jgi:segregation and condensation protein A
MMEKPYHVQLEEIFEGPMDLMIHLIRKNDLDIYDIPIALITDQYLQYLELMKAMNIDFAGDFLLMASTLTQIKSRMLLPTHDGEEEEEDPLQEITRPLLEYLQMKSAADQLIERNLLGENTFVRNPSRDEFLTRPDDEFIKIGLFELIDAFQKILERIPDGHRVELTADEISVKDKISQIVEVLEAKKSITFLELFSDDPNKHEVIITFLAILEMVKLTLIRIFQNVQTGILRIIYI